MADGSGVIDFCELEGKPSSGVIDFCEQESKPSSGVIDFCVTCEGLAPLVISGSEAPTAGSTYSASGGRAPYKFSISCGTINEETGQVSSLTGCCGVGSVTVRDACGNSATLEVRFPNGSWCASPTVFTPCNGAGLSGATCQVISGKTRIDYVGGYVLAQPPAGCVPPSSGCTTPPANYYMWVWFYTVYTWKCTC